MARAHGANRAAIVRGVFTTEIAAPMRLMSRATVPQAQHQLSPQMVASCGIQEPPKTVLHLPQRNLAPFQRGWYEQTTDCPCGLDRRGPGCMCDRPEPPHLT